ncbi:MAG: hypothetical protein A2539_08375 [Elusimicrobia bacterium RIFOXYD2_FULL_34_15]|nr:MAG: hypothetical protein A2539_08375 [Elusimicrobia bacterium RIFOXYD2_FULL_34_15]
MENESKIFKINIVCTLISLALFLFIPGGTITYADSPSALPIHINKISIVVHDIYDFKKSERLSFLYSWANKLHKKTNDNVVRRELLFKEGDKYDPALIVESERILRSYPYFRKVSIHVSEPEKDKVNIIVETHDAWTTEFQADWGTTASQTNWLLGFEELNVLGQGQRIKVSYKKNLDEKIQTFVFQDPRFLNSHVNLKTYFDKGEKSESWGLQCNRPFFATIAKWSAGFDLASQKESQELLTNGEKTSSFDAYHRTANIFTGYAITATHDKRSAVTLTGNTGSTVFSNIAVPNDVSPPIDRKLNGGTISYSFEKISFIKEMHITKFDRDEDFFLGPQHVVSYGMFPKKLGSTEEEKVFEYYYGRGVPINSGQFALFNLYSRNQFRQNMDNTGKQAISSQYYHRIARQNTLVVDMEFTKLINPDNDKELLLGGESGLRGYSVREFSGNKKFFFSIEDRLFLKDDVWKLFSVGGALFFDSGMVWRKDESVDLNEIKSDVGIGFRFGLTRSSTAKVVRVDLAYALNGNNRDNRWVLTIKSGQIFNPKGINDFRSDN